MATLTLNKRKLKDNFNFLNSLFKDHNKDWAVVTKILCGTEAFIKELIALDVPEVCDSRIQNLEVIKGLAPELQTVYIKPPALDEIEQTVRFADVSFNSESVVIKALNDEAVKQGKTHKIIIMIELGDLREGIMGDDLIDFYDKIFDLPNIEVVGLGANLNCLSGVMPSQDKYIQLSLYKQLIESKFNIKIPWITAGTSVVLPLLFKKQIPDAINHFRIGETLFFGNNLIEEEPIEGMHTDVFKLKAEIIEITKKPKVPIGVLAENPSGDVFEVDENEYGKTSNRAILNLGFLDIDPERLLPDDNTISIVNASSDMLIMDLGENVNSYKIGDTISFKLGYMGALGLLHSDYVDKTVIDTD